jgi:hypothetical protein
MSGERFRVIETMRANRAQYGVLGRKRDYAFSDIPHGGHIEGFA